MSFLSDRRGNFGVVAALLMVPLLLAGGLAIDYGMMTRNRSMLQDSLDAGLLAAGKLKQPIGQQRKLVKDNLEAQVAHLEMTGLEVEVNASANGRGLIGSATANYKPMLFIFPKSILRPIAVQAEVEAGSDSFLDAALVLDNTGSLGSDGLQAVRNAAQNFRAAIFDAVDNPQQVQMAVVPFAGAVNVGRNFPRNMLDVYGDATWHANWLENKWIARIGQPCPPIDWGPPTDPGTGSVESWLRSVPSGVQYAFDELLGIKRAHAGEAQDHGLPAGYTTTVFQNCNFLVSPTKVSNLALFDRMSNVDWGGCVEARADGFDTTDNGATSGNAASLFVPYFWPDEPDQFEGWVPKYVNNYMPDIGLAPPWNPATWATMEFWGRSQTITKYTDLSIALNGSQYVNGPNRGCPQPLLPLTSSETSVTTSLNAMTLAAGGGTIVSEGVGWGWRVLSSTAPFTEASNATKARRVMVVMTDGENQVSRNPQTGQSTADSPMQSDYSAYGYLRLGRLSTTFAGMEAELDARTLTTCRNAKEDGIEIYTVLFRSDSTRAINILKACASSQDKFFLAKDAKDLNATFSDIAASIDRYRLVK